MRSDDVKKGKPLSVEEQTVDAVQVVAHRAVYIKEVGSVPSVTYVYRMLHLIISFP